MGLCDRLLEGHSVRPRGVGWVSEPGRRIVIKTVRRRQPVKLESDPAGHPPTTLTHQHRQINGHPHILAAGWRTVGSTSGLATLSALPARSRKRGRTALPGVGRSRRR
jgi:hypothetical protein